MAEVSAVWGLGHMPRSGGSRGTNRCFTPTLVTLIQAGQTRCRPTTMPDKVDAASWGELVLEMAVFIIGGLVVALMLTTMLLHVDPRDRKPREKPSTVEVVEQPSDPPRARPLGSTTVRSVRTRSRKEVCDPTRATSRRHHSPARHRVVVHVRIVSRHRCEGDPKRAQPPPPLQGEGRGFEPLSTHQSMSRPSPRVVTAE